MRLGLAGGSFILYSLLLMRLFDLLSWLILFGQGVVSNKSTITDNNQLFLYPGHGHIHPEYAFQKTNLPSFVGANQAEINNVALLSVK